MATEQISLPENQPIEKNDLEHQLDFQWPVLKGFLDIQTLYFLFKSPMTGYSLRKRLWEEHQVKVSFGTLYPTLRRLHEDHLIVIHEKEFKGKATKNCKYYETTEVGLQALKERLLYFRNLAKEIGLS
jgi:PadR family transcriptional regulator, regulatory protein PadR